MKMSISVQVCAVPNC